MGANQSQPTPPTNREKLEELRQRLAEINMKNEESRNQDLEKGYVYLESNDEKRGTNDGLHSSRSATVSVENAEQWEEKVLESPKNRLAMAALLTNPMTSIITRTTATLADTQTFNIKIPFEGAPVTNQRSSGRCWLFAATNLFRVAIMKKHHLDQFELSQNYLFFWDKLEKANWFLEQVIDTADEVLEGRLVQELLGAPVSDGGQWDMVANLVAKYGLVPQTLYPDSYNAMSSGAMDSLVTMKLREDALQLRQLVNTLSSDHNQVAAAKTKMMQDIHRILVLMLGPPPKPDTKFKWEYYDKAGVYHSATKTPLAFASELSAPSLTRSVGGADVNKMFSLVNDPRNSYRKHLTVERLGNVVDGRPITYVNVDMQTMKGAAIAMLKAGLPVFFGSDVGKFSNSQTGVMDTKLWDFELAFNVDLGMDKRQRLQVKASQMTHAMVLTAVQVEDGKSVRWRVMNSWGESAGSKGYFVMSDAWMDEYVYQVVVAPSFVSKGVRDVLSQKAHTLPLWDPMGALA